MRFRRKESFGPYVLSVILTAMLLTTGVAAYSQAASPFPAYQLDGSAPNRFVTVKDGTLLAIREHGPAKGRTVLFVHGVAQNGQVFYSQLASSVLAPLHIVTIDRRGNGFSSKSEDQGVYSSHNINADDIEAVIQGLQLKKPVLAGWSAGGIAVFDYLQKYGDSNLSGVDLIDSIACPDSSCNDFVVSSVGGIQAFRSLGSSDAQTFFQGEAELANSESYGAVTPQQSLILQAIAAQTPYFVNLGNFATPPLVYSQVMSSLRVPVLIQYGANDTVFIDQAAIPTIQSLIKNQTTKIYPAGGHIPFILDANQFNVDLAEWLLTHVWPSGR